MNKVLIGKIVGGDSKTKTITIECEEGISGIQIGTDVKIIPIEVLNKTIQHEISSWWNEEIKNIYKI
jgi:hypothetical protein